MDNTRFETTRGKVDKAWQLVNQDKQHINRLSRLNTYIRSVTYSTSIYKFETEFQIAEDTANILYYGVDKSVCLATNLENFPEHIIQYLKINLIYETPNGNTDVIKKCVSTISSAWDYPMTYSDWIWAHRYWIEGILKEKGNPTDKDDYDFWLYTVLRGTLINYITPTFTGGDTREMTWKQLITIHMPNFYNEIKVAQK